MQPSNGHANGAARSAAPPQSSGPNEIIRPAINTTYTLQAETDAVDAQESPGRFGTQWMYFFGGHKLIYADQGLHDAMLRAGVTVGDEISITKTKNGQANVWLIENAGNRRQQQDRQQQQAWQPQAAPQQQPARAAQPLSADRMLHCYREAVDVAAQSECYAKERGLAVHATFEDVRCIAATLYINRVREDGGR
jgi:hypothetical protein